MMEDALQTGQADRKQCMTTESEGDTHKTELGHITK